MTREKLHGRIGGKSDETFGRIIFPYYSVIYKNFATRQSTGLGRPATQIVALLIAYNYFRKADLYTFHTYAVRTRLLSLSGMGRFCLVSQLNRLSNSMLGNLEFFRHVGHPFKKNAYEMLYLFSIERRVI